MTIITVENARVPNESLPVSRFLVALTGALVIAVAAQPAPRWLLMWSLAVCIFFTCKWLTVRKISASADGRALGYLLAWPGMDPAPFLNPSRVVAAPRGRQWLLACCETLFGAVLLWPTAGQVGPQRPLVAGWIAMIGLIFLLHFGLFHLVALWWRSNGVDAQPIMRAPILSRSLAEFWSMRWNTAFRSLTYRFVYQPLHRRIGVAGATLVVFLVSGSVHDLVISVPAGGGYGLPTAYFLIQALGVLFERSTLGKRLGLRRGAPGQLYTAAIITLPVGILFHQPFVIEVILPFADAIGAF